eukprot:4112358-Amphidinium_carterae.1
MVGGVVSAELQHQPGRERAGARDWAAVANGPKRVSSGGQQSAGTLYVVVGPWVRCCASGPRLAIPQPQCLDR